MNFNLIDIIIVCSFILPLIISYKRKFNIIRIKHSIEELGGYLAFFLALYLSFIFIKKVNVIEKAFSILVVEFNSLISGLNISPQVIIALIVLFLTLILYFLVRFVFLLFNFIIVNPILKWLKNAEAKRGKKFGKRAALILNIPKAIFYMVISTLVIVILGSNGYLGSKMEELTVNSKSYEILKDNDYYAALTREYKSFHEEYESAFSRGVESEPKEGTEKRVEKQVNVINLYNGVTLEQGIKSNKYIDEKAIELTKNAKTDKEKAKILYKWISENITYDDEKAKNITGEPSQYKSGAIEAFESRRGICFDYSCLYVAMAREVGLKVRIITGEGFNGKEWGPHSWNEVYLKDEDRWITVDPTFGKAGNYFDSRKNIDSHKNAEIIGEW
ncbi:transglutaminase domain-containing protein [Clostridium sp. B9]|uniref:transglutaminase domain-containing protein n=1 Tax=Clostridium sp. B9 TaxID=3423224 RepID=UPI003D2F254A